MKKLRLRATLNEFFLLLVICMAFGCAGRISTRTGHPHHSPGADSGPSVIEAYGAIPLHFEANVGQTDDRVKFLTRGAGYTMFLTGNGAVLVFSGPSTRERNTVLSMMLVGAHTTPHVEGRGQLPGKANYFKGNDPANWRLNVPTYETVEYQNVYPGIGLKYYGNSRQLEYDFVVQPGVDPNRIDLEFQGAEKTELDRNGDLVLHLIDATVRHRKPFIYQEVEGERRTISGGYVLKDNGRIGFYVGAYDSSVPLIVDPAVLFYSTYLGGSGFDSGTGIAVDEAGNAYAAGYTTSTDFPTTAGAFQASAGGDYDAFVTKLNPTGSGLVYSTYLGGTSFDIAGPVTFDADGNAYVAGSTSSTDFPTTAGAFDTSFNGVGDAFIAKLNPTGSALVYSTYLGGDSDEGVNGIAVETAGSVAVAGFTSSSDFPTTLLAFDTIFNGGPEDGFVTKLDPAGSDLVYSTYLGGGGDDYIASAALDFAGNTYVTGVTDSSNFPTTVGSFDTTFNGGASDAFVTKLNSTGSALLYSTFLGGSTLDGSQGLAVDSTGTAYVGGSTDSTDFPTTAGAFQTTLAGAIDIFITKLNVAGSGIVYSTYLGGSNSDFGGSLALDPSGNAYATGATFSTDFPTTSAVFQSVQAGDLDAFVTKINAAGSALVYSSYLGGSDLDSGQDIALDPFLNAYIVGVTYSTDFPTTPGAFQTTGAGDADAFVTKIAEDNPAGGPFTERVKGGGTINVAGGTASFSFMIRRSSSGLLSGHLQYFNHTSGTHVRSETYASLLIVGNTATFDGDCTNNGSPCTFKVDVTDNGEPGTNDSFTISVSPGPPEGGTLRSGNILIQQ